MGKKRNSRVQHVAIIMDGNGRWAKQRGLKHNDGHREGAKAVRRTISAAKDLGIKYLTLYAFSTENWKRSPAEVQGLMSLLREFIDSNLDEIQENKIRIKAIGRIDQVPLMTRRKLLKAIEDTKDNTAGTVIIALSYGGRAEIVDATRKIVADVQAGVIKPKSIDEALFSQYLYDPDIPDPELMIRTSGEFRISNFLLWQLSYAEIYISDLLWPDFDKAELEAAISSYGNRERRYGGR